MGAGSVTNRLHQALIWLFDLKILHWNINAIPIRWYISGALISATMELQTEYWNWPRRQHLLLNRQLPSLDCFPAKEGRDFSRKNIPRGLLMRSVWCVTSQTGLPFLEQFKHVEAAIQEAGKVSQKNVKLVA